MSKLTGITILFLIFSFPVYAVEDFYQFSSKEQQTRFTTLTSQLRCLVCQNQNLAESNAPLANDLRDQIYTKIQRGQSNQEIVQYLVTRYGDFILYRPPFNVVTMGLWLGPLLVLLSSLGYLLFYIYKRKRTSPC